MHERPWRQRLRANAHANSVYRTGVALVGLVVVVAGLIMVPFPGPGWLVVFAGVAIWATEFHWARRLNHYGLEKLRVWNAWVMAQRLWVRAAIAGATCAFVCACVWFALWLTGLPPWTPGWAADPLRTWLAL